MLELAKPPLPQQVRGQTSYIPKMLQRGKAQSAQSWEQVSGGEIISVVSLQYHPQKRVYTLANNDKKGLDSWLEGQMRREAAAAQAAKQKSPCEPTADPVDTRPSVGPSHTCCQEA